MGFHFHIGTVPAGPRRIVPPLAFNAAPTLPGPPPPPLTADGAEIEDCFLDIGCPVLYLVERFDIEPFSDFSAK